MRKLSKQQQRRITERQERQLPPDSRTGTVVSRHKRHVLLFTDNNTHQRCDLRQHLGDVVVGDQVHWAPQDNDNKGVVLSVLPRTTVLAQKNKLIAANISQLIIVSALEPAWDNVLIDRFILLAELNSIAPIIVFNKSDLVTSQATPLSLYHGLGYETLLVSATKHHNLGELQQLMANQSNALVGLSGVGKSSLANALIPDLNQQTNRLTKANHGSHTTSTARLFHLPQGGSLIDSPGLREITLDNIDQHTVVSGFKEFTPYIGHCKYRNCKHQHEPDCAILAAVNDGIIALSRYESFIQLT